MVLNGLPAIYPGGFLAETLEEMGISQGEFARAIGCVANAGVACGAWHPAGHG